MIDEMADNSPGSKNLILTIKRAPETLWEAKSKAQTTSKEIFEVYEPKRTVAEGFDGVGGRLSLIYVITAWQ
jgi:hypothetical protein